MIHYLANVAGLARSVLIVSSVVKAKHALLSELDEHQFFLDTFNIFRGIVGEYWRGTEKDQHQLYRMISKYDFAGF